MTLNVCDRVGRIDHCTDYSYLVNKGGKILFEIGFQNADLLLEELYVWVKLEPDFPKLTHGEWRQLKDMLDAVGEYNLIAQVYSPDKVAVKFIKFFGFREWYEAEGNVIMYRRDKCKP